jgi:hypothetical protein
VSVLYVGDGITGALIQIPNSAASAYYFGKQVQWPPFRPVSPGIRDHDEVRAFIELRGICPLCYQAHTGLPRTPEHSYAGKYTATKRARFEKLWQGRNVKA